IQSILLYIAIAAVIALIGRPIVFFFESRLRFPTNLSVVITLFLIFGVILGIVSTLIPVINQQSENFAKLNLEELKTNLNMLNYQVRDFLGIERKDLFDRINITNYLEDFDFKSVPIFMSSIFGKVGAIIIGSFAVIFIS